MGRPFLVAPATDAPAGAPRGHLLSFQPGRVSGYGSAAARAHAATWAQVHTGWSALRVQVLDGAHRMRYTDGVPDEPATLKRKHTMQLNSTQLATLRKFNNGKHGKDIAESCPDQSLTPGTHPVSITVTLDGYVDRSPDREQTRTTFPASSKAFAIALSKVNPATRAVIVAAVLEVQRGGEFTASAEVQAAVKSLQVRKTTPVTGDTVFRGRIAVEDCEGHAPADITGITLVESCG